MGVEHETGDQVLAGRLHRLGAVILDGVVGCVLMLPAYVLAFVGLADAEDTAFESSFALTGLAGVLLLVGIVVFLVVQCYFLATRGQTIGKMILKIKIVRNDDGTNPGFWRAVGLRWFVNGLVPIVPLLGSIYAIVDPLFIFGQQRLCLHDYLAGTKVVEA
jgi:uncharacterized RDD family membrane protein YckC